MVINLKSAFRNFNKNRLYAFCLLIHVVYLKKFLRKSAMFVAVALLNFAALFQTWLKLFYVFLPVIVAQQKIALVFITQLGIYF